MINKIFTSIITFIALSISCMSQSYSGPESVEWDSLNNRYLISNTTTKTILARSSTGVLSTFKVLAVAPYGLEIVGTKLYVCNSNKITVLDLNTAAQLTQITCAGASFLNGITHDNNGNVFATDYSAKKIYRINTVTNTANLFVSNTVDTPNGICFDAVNNRLIYGTWGTGAKIKSVSLTDSSQTTLTTTTFGSIDGITIDPLGNIYIAAWSTDVLVRFTNDCSQYTTVMTGLNNPADICYNTQSDSIAIPNSGNNTVVFYYNLLTSTFQLEKNELSVYPNPATEFIQINNRKFEKQSYEILSLNSGLISTKGVILDNKINVSLLEKGLYLLVIKDTNIRYKFLKN